jgi:hypothetical protein
MKTSSLFFETTLLLVAAVLWRVVARLDFPLEWRLEVVLIREFELLLVDALLDLPLLPVDALLDLPLLPVDALLDLPL